MTDHQTSARPKKKPKTTEKRDPKKANFRNRDCHIIRLPFELIAEVLLLTNSPKDVLAVARCSKFFCATLLYPSSQYIWRHVRQNCKPEPLPEPIPKFTEASYAAFVFDAGKCEVSCRNYRTLVFTFLSSSFRFALSRAVRCMPPMVLDYGCAVM